MSEVPLNRLGVGGWGLGIGGGGLGCGGLGLRVGGWRLGVGGWGLVWGWFMPQPPTPGCWVGRGNAPHLLVSLTFSAGNSTRLSTIPACPCMHFIVNMTALNLTYLIP